MVSNLPTLRAANILDIDGRKIYHTVCKINDYSSALTTVEAKIALTSSATRRKEFSSGRYCAKAIFRQIGLNEEEILRDNYGAPMWPKGFVGSISHTKRLAICVVGKQSDFGGLGVDLERSSFDYPEIYPLVFTCDELRRCTGVNQTSQARLAALTFSAKEAAFKAIFPTLRQRLGFHDFEVHFRSDFESERGELALSLPRGDLTSTFPIEGLFFVRKELVVTLVYTSGSNWTASEGSAELSVS